jgi:hypothetical protein
MSKLVESFLTDAVERVKTPEIQTLIHENVLAPLLSALLNYLAPYIIGIGIVWTLILVGIFFILWRLYRIQ